MRVLPRAVEGVIGDKLIQWGTKQQVKKAGLVLKKVALPKSGFDCHYLEKNSSGGNGGSMTVLMFHGMSDKAENMAGFVSALQLSDNVRIIVPDAVGHGKDLQRAFNKDFVHPTPHDLIESMLELVEVLQIEKRCVAIGYSMGGALAYWLHAKRPEIVIKSVLICPALETCVSDQFWNEFESGSNRFFCFETRTQLKRLLRDVSHPSSSSPSNKKKNDPIPKFLLQGCIRQRQRTTPPKHYDAMMDVMSKERGGEFSNVVDVDKDAPRLVLWATHDVICSHEKGKAYFDKSTRTEFVSVDSGHCFLADGTPLLAHVAPQVRQFVVQEQSL